MATDKPKNARNQTVDLINSQIKNDITIAKKLMGDEFIKYAVANGGAIDIKNAAFSKGADFLLHSEPAPGTFKLTNVEAGAQEKITKAINLGANKDDFKNANAELKQLRSELESKTKSNEGIKELISESLKTASLSQVPFWKIGLEDINDPAKGTRLMGLDPTDKLALTEKLKPSVKFPDDVTSFLKHGPDVIAKEVAPVVQKTMIEFFAQDSSKNSKAPVLDNEKLTSANLKKFSEKLNNNLNKLSEDLAERQNRKVAANKIVQDTISSLEQDKKFKFNDKQKEEIQSKLFNELTKFDSSYLADKGNEIKDKLTKDLVSKKSFSLFSKDFKISQNNLDKVTQNIAKEHGEASKQFSKKVISPALQAEAKVTIANKELRPVNSFARKLASENQKSSPKELRKAFSEAHSLLNEASVKPNYSKDIQQIGSKENYQLKTQTTPTPVSADQLPPLPPRNRNNINSKNRSDSPPPLPPRNGGDYTTTIATNKTSPKAQQNIGAQQVFNRDIAGRNSASQFTNSKFSQEIASNSNILYKHGARKAEYFKGNLPSPSGGKPKPKDKGINI